MTKPKHRSYTVGIATELVEPLKQYCQTGKGRLSMRSVVNKAIRALLDDRIIPESSPEDPRQMNIEGIDQPCPDSD